MIIRLLGPLGILSTPYPKGLKRGVLIPTNYFVVVNLLQLTLYDPSWI